MSERMTEDMPERMSEVCQKEPDKMSRDMVERLSETMSE